MNKLFKRIASGVGLCFLGILAYVFYIFYSAEGRVTEICSAIHSGMSVPELNEFSASHGLGPAVTDSTGVKFIVEKKSFGRYGCKVTIENGHVSSAEYNFSS